MIYLFYGTLKRDEYNNKLVSTQTFLGEGKTRGYSIFQKPRHSYPHAAKTKPACILKGHLYWIIDKRVQANLDSLEQGYTKAIVPVIVKFKTNQERDLFIKNLKDKLDANLIKKGDLFVQVPALIFITDFDKIPKDSKKFIEWNS